ncbi:MAG: CPBP family intramembrane metalloprotease [Actinobacteria bacterium]|nr:CPBP family intramembrane metalloprotease [Actinomycetota bacterium]
MAASGKKKGTSSGRTSAVGKGANSRTGGRATPRAPKPRDDRVEGASAPPAKRNSPSAKNKKKKATAQPQPRAGRAKGSSNGKRAAVVADDEILDREHDDANESGGGDGGQAPLSLADRGRLLFANLINPPDVDGQGGERSRPERAPARTREAPVDAHLPDGTRVPRWGMGDVALGWFAGLFVPQIVMPFVLVGLGYVFVSHDGTLGGDGAAIGEAVGRMANGQASAVVKSPEYAPIMLGYLLPQVLMWASLMGVTAWAVITKGNGFVKDLKLRAKWIDVPVGLAIGVAVQLLVIPALYWVVSRFTDQNASGVARRITDQAVDPLSTVLIFLGVGVAAPLVEEIFYRGLMLRSVEKRFGAVWALVGTSAFFALTHGYLIVLPGIFVLAVILGLLTQRTDRLGPAIFAHMGFNLVTTTVLVFNLKLPVG